MKLMKGLLSAFAVVLATTACAGNSGENKKSNESTKEDNKMEVVALNKADFYRVMERIFALSSVQDILLDMTLEDDEDDIENIRFAFADENQIAHDPRGIPSFEQS